MLHEYFLRNRYSELQILFRSRNSLKSSLRILFNLVTQYVKIVCSSIFPTKTNGFALHCSTYSHEVNIFQQQLDIALFKSSMGSKNSCEKYVAIVRLLNVIMNSMPQNLEHNIQIHLHCAPVSLLISTYLSTDPLMSYSIFLSDVISV